MAASQPLPQPSGEDLLRIFERAMASNPRNYRPDLDPSVIGDMVGSSPLVDALRQSLPDRLGSTAAGRHLLEWLAPEQPGPRASRVLEAIKNLPLGGYRPRYLADFEAARAASPSIRWDTTRLGQVPLAGGISERPAQTFRERGAQVAGLAAGDLAGDGLRNIWWFLNAPQAIATVATLSALHGAAKPYRNPLQEGTALRNRNWRLATAVPAVLGMSMAIGNAGRLPGYKAVVPSQADPTVSADPLMEGLSRYFLGRSGGLLPYERFVQERPDVSRSEYEAYKAYLHGNALPLKATLDGIQGPEVTFMGKSIPVATGILPAIAAVAGTAYGTRMAGKRLLDQGKLKQARYLAQEMKDLKGELSRGEGDPELVAEYNAVVNAYKKLERENDKEFLKQSLLYSSLGLSGAALAGQTLESIRRAMNGPAPAEPVELGATMQPPI